MKQIKYLSLVFAVVISITMASTAQAFLSGSAPIEVSEQLPPVFTDDYGRAIKGYDAVAYFTEDEALYGKDEYNYRWNGAIWHFINAENRDSFIADPKRYAPQYGGYCAYAMSLGYAVKIDPEAWTIHQGKLYLNQYSVRYKWLEDVKSFIVDADNHWQRVEFVR